MAKDDLPVIIVGAGLSGLSAAKLLHENGEKVLVLEASGRLGGRTFTRNGPKTSYVDMGGSYVCVGQDCILNLVEEFQLETFKVYNTGKSVLLSDDNKYYYANGAPILSLLNPIVCMDLMNYLRRFAKDCDMINAADPWNSPKATELDNMTMKEYIERICWTKVVSGAANSFVSFNVCGEGHEVSALYFLWFIKQRGGINRMFSNANQASKIVGGSQILSEKLANIIKGQIEFNKIVISVTQTENDVTVTTKDGQEYKGKQLILSIPPNQQKGILFEPGLSGFRHQLHQRMPMGCVIKVIIYYDKPFWRHLGYNGNTVSTSHTQTKHPLAYTLDDSKPDGSFPAIIGFLVGDTARRLAETTPEHRKHVIAQSLKEIFKSEDALNPVHYEEYNWMSDAFTGGCYVGFCFPGVITGYWRFIREPMGRLYFAGTETSTKWSGYMDGAIRAGFRAAREVLRDNGIDVPDNTVKGFEPMRRSLLEKTLPTITQSLTIVTAVAIITFIGWYRKTT